MVTLIFRSLLLMWTIFQCSSSEQQRRSKTTVSPSLPHLQLRPAASANSWIPSRPITLSTPNYNRFAVSTHPSTPRKPDSYNSYKYHEPDQLPVRHRKSESHDHGKVDNNYTPHSSPVTFQRDNEQSFIPTVIPISPDKDADPRGYTSWPNIRKDHDHADVVAKSTAPPGASLHNRKFHLESIPVVENNPRAKSRIEFSDDDFDVIFNTQPQVPPKNVHIPIHRNIEHYELLSDQPQLHFHMNPLQQTLYNTRAFGSMGRSQMFTDLPKRDENRLESGGVMESFDPFRYSDFSEIPASNIFKNYDKIFGKHSKIKPEAFRVQTHYPSRNEGNNNNNNNKQVEEEDDEYRSEESSHEKYEKSGEDEDEEKASEDTRLERFEESYREDNPYRGSKYVKKAERYSSERPEGRFNADEEENRRSIEIDEKIRTTTKFPPFRYKSHHERPSEEKSQRSNSQKHKKEHSHASRKIHS